MQWLGVYILWERRLEELKILTRRRYAKSHVWRIVLSGIFSKMLREIRRRDLCPLEIIYADKEFQHHYQRSKRFLFLKSTLGNM